MKDGWMDGGWIDGWMDGWVIYVWRQIDKKTERLENAALKGKYLALKVVDRYRKCSPLM